MKKETYILNQVRSARGSRSTCCPRQCYFARGDIWGEKTSFNTFLGEGETDGRLHFQYEQFTYGHIRYITNDFCKNLTKIATP